MSIKGRSKEKKKQAMCSEIIGKVMEVGVPQNIDKETI